MAHLAKIIIGTRRSPLALAQAELAKIALEKSMPTAQCILREFVTQGDKKLSWSLEKSGGKGLFTAELEDALLRGEIELAVHSGKDLPSELPPGLCVAGCLPREQPNDILVLREGTKLPTTIATGSPRRRDQAKKLFPNANFKEIRGNVHTRLQKIADGFADATFLAAAGLHRLNLNEFPGLEFREMPLTQIVPAAAQAAIALQCREENRELFASACCLETTHEFRVERCFLEELGEGCHTSFAVNYSRGNLLIFREDLGLSEHKIVFSQEQETLRNEVKIFLKSLFKLSNKI